jgi:hypothetical protein
VLFKKCIFDKANNINGASLWTEDHEIRMCCRVTC